jgi:hypothetical protein
MRPGALPPILPGRGIVHISGIRGLMRIRRITAAYWIALSYLPPWAVRCLPRAWRHQQVRRFVDEVVRKS